MVTSQKKEQKMNLNDYKTQFENFGDDYHANYETSFPIAVFGTLRKIPSDQGNLHRMLTRDPVGHRKAFIPHMLPSGIWVEFEEGASGIFEVFFYDKKDFATVIKSVDALEGFSPDNHYGYHRTLLKARLLPDDHSNNLFKRGIRNFDNRSLNIPEDEWEDFETVPAWAYSNATTNNSLAEIDDSPLLWWH